MRNPYLLDEQAQQCLKASSDLLWQAYALLEFVQKSMNDDDLADHYTALSGVLTLMSKGLDNLGEV